jgi:DNA-binding Lrp family transcriptional regulator
MSTAALDRTDLRMLKILQSEGKRDNAEPAQPIWW